MPNQYRLYLVTDADLTRGRPLLELVEKAVAGGVTCVQIRDKKSDSRQIYDDARRLLDFLRPRGIPLIVNDRLDIAIAVGADGAHLGQRDLPCEIARRLVPPAFTIGVSVSTVDETIAATAAGADYLGISPVFDTPTKTDTPTATGLRGLEAIRAVTHLPLVAIGGINTSNAAAVLAAGADGLAVVSAILMADDPELAARQLAGHS